MYIGVCAFESAEATLREALAIRRRELPSDHPAIAATLQSLGLALLCLGDVEAISVLERPSASSRHRGDDEDAEADASYFLGMALIGARRASEADPMIDRALAIRRRRGGERSLPVGMSPLGAALSAPPRGIN